MARIRSIKPDFWTSEQVLACSRDARLFFIGLWNFADDGGVHPNQPKNLRVKIFPDDEDITSENVRGFIAELSTNGLIGIFVHDDVEYIHIFGWAKHQRIDKPSPKHPKPPKDRSLYIGGSKKTPRAVAEASPPDGWMEGGREGSIDHSPHSTTTSGGAAGSGSLDAPPARPTAVQPELVTVQLPSGAKLTIDHLGNFDEVWAPMDCPATVLSRKQALDLRARAIAERDRPPDRSPVPQTAA